MMGKLQHLLLLYFVTISCCVGLNCVKKNLEIVTIESVIQNVWYDNSTFRPRFISDLKNISVLSIIISPDSVLVKNSLGPFTKTISVSTNGIIQKGGGGTNKPVDTLKITHQPNTALNIYVVSDVDVIVKNNEGPFVNKDTGNINALIQKGEKENTVQVVTLKTDRKDIPKLSVFIMSESEVIVLNEVGAFTDKICISSSGIVRKTGSEDKITDSFNIVRDKSTNLNAHISSDDKVTEEAMKNALEPIISKIGDSITAIVARLGNENVALISTLKTTHRSIIHSTEAIDGNLASKLYVLKEIAEGAWNDISESMKTPTIKVEIKAALERLKNSLLQFQNILADFLAIRLPLSFHITTL